MFVGPGSFHLSLNNVQVTQSYLPSNENSTYLDQLLFSSPLFFPCSRPSVQPLKHPRFPFLNPFHYTHLIPKFTQSSLDLTMDQLKGAYDSFTGGNRQQEGQPPAQGQQESSSGGGGLLGGLGDKINSAAGGGRESEKNEDYLDKGKSWSSPLVGSVAD